MQGQALAVQLRKTKLCVYHLQSTCRLGSSCAFAHTLEELQRPPDLRKTRLCRLHAVGGCRDKTCQFAHGRGELRATGQFFKRSLCKFYQAGRCRNGARCRFAHGAEELHPEPADEDPVARGHSDLGEPMKVRLPELGPAPTAAPATLATSDAREAAPLLTEAWLDYMARQYQDGLLAHAAGAETPWASCAERAELAGGIFGARAIEL